MCQVTMDYSSSMKNKIMQMIDPSIAMAWLAFMVREWVHRLWYCNDVMDFIICKRIDRM